MYKFISEILDQQHKNYNYLTHNIHRIRVIFVIIFIISILYDHKMYKTLLYVSFYYLHCIAVY